MSGQPFQGSQDIQFSVPCTHRMRFTQDVFGADAEVLLDLLDPGELEVARVQFWVDANLVEAQPELLEKIKDFCHLRPHVRRVGPVKLVQGGEALKNDILVLERILKFFNVCDLDRRSYVVILGGGAVLDTVGFAAAIAHRGLRVVRLPSTTLGQADSGVGVKNGVNLFQKKNWLGSFHVPWAVVNDTSLLNTLGDRDFICGFSEAVKVSLLKDADFFGRICELAPRIAARDMAAAGPVICDSAGWHLQHITRGGDPFEENQARPLDFGHWSAHKLEAMSDFELRHGEAVAIGVAVDVVYSHMVHGLPLEQAYRVLRCLLDLGFQLDHPTLLDTEGLFAGLEEFRQHLGGQLTVTMLKEVGQPLDVHEIDHAKMRLAMRLVSDFAQTGELDIVACELPGNN